MRLIDADSFRQNVTGMQFRIMIDAQPTIDATPVIHAKWVPSLKHLGYLVCSNCYDAYVEPEWLTGCKWKYCPSCGAKMGGDPE